MDVVGFTMSKNCANKVFSDAGFKGEREGRDQVGVVELHDCFSANEVMISDSQYTSLVLTFGPIQLITYDALGLCEPGQAHKLVERGDNTVCLTVELHISTFSTFSSLISWPIVWWQVRDKS